MAGWNYRRWLSIHTTDQRATLNSYTINGTSSWSKPAACIAVMVTVVGGGRRYQ